MKEYFESLGAEFLRFDVSQKETIKPLLAGGRGPGVPFRRGLQFLHSLPKAGSYQCAGRREFHGNSAWKKVLNVIFTAVPPVLYGLYRGRPFH